MVDAKAFRTFIIISSLFKRERLKVSMKLMLYKALIRSVMACSVWELAVDTRLLKPLRLKNWVPHSIGNFSRCTPVRRFHMAFNLPYVYGYITKLQATSRSHTKS
jgi:hypothetical protein